MASIAREAGVSTETVKAAASKPELLVYAFEVAFAGTEGGRPIEETDIGRDVLDLPDAQFFDELLVRITAANARAHTLWTVLLGASLSDEGVRSSLARMLDRRRDSIRQFTGELARRGLLSGRDIEGSADAISFLASPEGYQQLVAQSGWSDDRYRTWLGEAILRTG